jgi:acyl-CoA thioesterase YciA
MKPNPVLPRNREPILRVITRPNDANPMGDIFGGWLLSQMDIAGATIASVRAQGMVSTVAVNELKFLHPIYIYELVSFYGEVIKTGNTSITVAMEAYAQKRTLTTEAVKVADAKIVYVAIQRPGVKRTLPPEVPV